MGGDSAAAVMGMEIDGLRYVPGFVPVPQERELLVHINSQPWLATLRRRVQHYGYRYDYKARKVDRSMHLGPLPDWTGALTAQLVSAGHFGTPPDQLIVNEYDPGQGIAPRIPCQASAAAPRGCARAPDLGHSASGAAP
jgi:alkylated DNA repair dioxygenase AlkB